MVSLVEKNSHTVETSLFNWNKGGWGISDFIKAYFKVKINTLLILLLGVVGLLNINQDNEVIFMNKFFYLVHLDIKTVYLLVQKHVIDSNEYAVVFK